MRKKIEYGLLAEADLKAVYDENRMGDGKSALKVNPRVRLQILFHA
jgi:hypothetical protein